MKTVRKAVIPAAGYGTRFLPMTKSVPKEMLPVMDKPIIQHIIEEALASGIEKVILVTSESKKTMEEYLAEVPEFAGHLHFIRQTGPYGTATPVKNAQSLIGDEPFLLMYGDELFLGKQTRVQQLIEAFETTGHPILGVIQTDDEGTKRYGIVDPRTPNPDCIFRVYDFFEKPGPERATSRLASIGAYILTPDVFEKIEMIHPAANGEYQMTDAYRLLMEERPFYGCTFRGTCYDTGSKIGWLEANLVLGLRDNALGKQDLASFVQP